MEIVERKRKPMLIVLLIAVGLIGFAIFWFFARVQVVQEVNIWGRVTQVGHLSGETYPTRVRFEFDSLEPPLDTAYTETEHTVDCPSPKPKEGLRVPIAILFYTDRSVSFRCEAYVPQP